jgi:non-heme chloroperoxidase
MSSANLSITDHELAEAEHANATGRQPIIFIHGLWLLPSSWNRWKEVFESAGYVGLTPGWPDDPETVAEANADPAPMAGKTIGQVVDHFASIASKLKQRPAIVGHSFGGLLAQILAGRGLSAATVAIDPAAFRGVLPLPFSALKSAFPVLGNPANRNRAVPLTYEQFRYAFANALDEAEAKSLYEAAAANFNPWTEDKVETETANRGPLLIVSGEKDHTVPPKVAEAAFKLQKRNSGLTEFLEMKDRGHALIIDHGWREVADAALSFVKRVLKSE